MCTKFDCQRITCLRKCYNPRIQHTQATKVIRESLGNSGIYLKPKAVKQHAIWNVENAYIRVHKMQIFDGQRFARLV